MRTLVIDAAALARNLDRLRRAASARIIGVVKGNGYGLGLTDYARFRSTAWICWLCPRRRRLWLCVRRGSRRRC